MADISSSGPPDGINVGRLQQAYQRNYDEMSALERTDVITVNLDVPSVYTLGSAALLRSRPYREQILGLPYINKALVEKVDDYLLALGHAQALHIASIKPVASIPELYAKLVKLREMLLADCVALATRGRIPGDKLKELRGSTSHSDTAFDVLALVAFIRSNWAAIGGQSALQLSDLENGETLADQLLTALGERAAADETSSSAALNRQRAYTLFLRAYDELRRGLVYLRWHERDVDEIAPSLYSTRIGRRPRPSTAEEVTEEEATAGPTGAPTTGAPAPAAGAPNPGAPVGHPDSPPFTS
jgi:hypothetical protein